MADPEGFSLQNQATPNSLDCTKAFTFRADWWTDWVSTLQSLAAAERFTDTDYLIPTLSKDFQGVIPRPGSSDRSLRWLKEALVGQGCTRPWSHLSRGTSSGSILGEIGRLNLLRTSGRRGTWWWTSGEGAEPDEGYQPGSR